MMNGNILILICLSLYQFIINNIYFFYSTIDDANNCGKRRTKTLNNINNIKDDYTRYCAILITAIIGFRFRL